MHIMYLELTTMRAENKIENGLILNVVVEQCKSILQLFAIKDELLLVWWNVFHFLDLITCKAISSDPWVRGRNEEA